MAKRRRKRLTAKQRNRRRALFSILFIAIITIGVHLVKNNLVTIKDIRIQGNKKVSREEILKRGRVDLGGKLYKQDAQAIEAKIKAIPYIKDAKVKRSIRGILSIRVQERSPVAQLNFRDHYVNVDQDLRILEKTMQFQPDYIKINGLTIKNLQMGSYLFLNDKQKDLRKMVTGVLEGDLRDKIQAIDIKDQGLDLLTKDDIQVVFESTKDSDYKCKQLLVVLEKIKTMDKNISMILMDKGKDPVAVTESNKAQAREDANNMTPLKGGRGEKEEKDPRE